VVVDGSDVAGQDFCVPVGARSTAQPGGLRATDWIIAVAVVLAPLLTSCSSEYSEEPWMAYNQRCEQLGFKRGSTPRGREEHG
jgi:hypothetical protein